MLTIGELASATGVPTSTIRFWERRALLTPDARSGGQRRYREQALTRVGVLKLCQDAGFTLAEIRQLMATSGPGWRELVTAKMVTVTENLHRLQKAHDLLAHALECPHEDINECPLFRTAVRSRSGVRPEPADCAPTATPSQ